MATILTKKKDTSGAPSAGDLTNSSGGAELAVNTADKRLYTKDSGGNVVEVGINPTSITTGTLNTSGAVVFNDAGADVDFRVESDTNENALFVEGSSGNVGIGTSSPTAIGSGVATLDLVGTSGGGIRFERTGATASTGFLAALNGSVILSSIDALPLIFRTDNTERMRIDSSGNVLVGKTVAGSSVAGLELNANDVAQFTRDGNHPLVLNRLTSDGDLAQFRKDGTAVGTIGVNATDNFVIECLTANHAGLQFATSSVLPRRNAADADNAVDLGELANRFDDIYATNGTIQTSDRNEKQDIEELTEAETRVAVAAKALMRKYRWKSAVEEKGDDARIHFGIIAQDLQAAFEAEGLDAGRYAMFIHSAWWEKERVIPAVEGKEAVLDDEGNVVEEAVEAQPERTVIDTFETEEEAGEGAVRKERMGIRYNELLAFIIAAI